MSSIPVRVNPATKKDMLRRALRIKEAHYGGDHYQVAITLSNLANAHGILGNPAAKRDMLQRALRIVEAHHGGDHYPVDVRLAPLQPHAPSAAWLRLLAIHLLVGSGGWLDGIPGRQSILNVSPPARGVGKGRPHSAGSDV